MSNYAVCRFKKIKDKRALATAYGHNYRTKSIYAKNADPSRKERNEELIPYEGERNFGKILDRRIKESPYYKQYKVKSNAVVAGEVVLSFSRERLEDIDIEEWKRRNVEWLYKRFGKENVISAMYHDDEKTERGYAVPHIHAIILPFDEKGCLNMRETIRTRDDMVNLQTEYAKEMEFFGLMRGEVNSKRKHLQPSDYHKVFKESYESFEEHWPAREHSDTDIDYEERCKAYVKEELKKKDIEIIKLNDEIDKRDTTIKNMENDISLDDVLYEQERKRQKRIQEGIMGTKQYASIMKHLRLNKENVSESDLNVAAQIASKGDMLDRILEAYPDRNYAIKTLDALNVMRDYYKANIQNKGTKEQDREVAVS